MKTTLIAGCSSGLPSFDRLRVLALDGPDWGSIGTAIEAVSRAATDPSPPMRIAAGADAEARAAEVGHE